MSPLLASNYCNYITGNMYTKAGPSPFTSPHVVGKATWVAEVWLAGLNRENRCPLIRVSLFGSLGQVKNSQSAGMLCCICACLPNWEGAKAAEWHKFPGPCPKVPALNYPQSDFENSVSQNPAM